MSHCSTEIEERLVSIFREQVRAIVAEGKATSIGAMETGIETALREVGAGWLATWLGQLGEAAMPPEIPCRCGEMGEYQRLREGVLLTPFGRVSFKRRYYLCPHCHEGQYPLDEQLGYEPGQMTPQLTSMAGWIGAELPFERGSALLEGLCGITLSENSVREATQRVGQAVQEQEKAWQTASEDVQLLKERDRLPTEGKPARLYGSMDGVLAPVGQEYRELKVGSWYREGERKGTEEQTPRATEISYFCDIAPAEEFGRLLWATGCQRTAEQAQELVFVADGAPWIWNLVADYFPKAVQIVDWYHAVEYIAPIAQAAFGENSTQGQAWQDQVITDLWEGRFQQVLEQFQHWLDHPKAGAPAAQAYGYYVNNRERMRYLEFRAQGYRIGSGTVESACKQIGTQRLKVAGARWSEEGARQTAKARAALLSGQWNQVSARFGAVPLAA
jgi:hypothetical protein